jgi:hypothetical protein
MQNNEIVLAEIVRLPRSQMPAPAYTDGLKIYIANNLSHREESLAIYHEQAHILLNHFYREIKMKNAYHDFNKENWVMSTELEIARNLYTIEDEDLIKSKRSGLYRGITSDSIPELPSHIDIAEDIYDYLIKNNKKCTTKCICMQIESTNNENDIKPKEQISYTTKEVKEILEKMIEAISKKAKKEQLIKNNSDHFENIKKRKPTLVSEIDKSLRLRSLSQKTYNRPNRYYNEDYILKGRMTNYLSPLVEIFLDRSASFCDEKTKKANEVINAVLKKYGSSIKKDVWFFGDNKISSKDFNGGNTPYHLIIEHLNKTNPKIAIIITDDDLADECEKIKNSKTKVLCVPVGCYQTDLNKKGIGIDVIW